MIGVFDSGIGGLTVLNSFVHDLPDYDYLYLGDNARTPYGNKSLDVIYEYTRQAVDFLFGRGCILIVLACNTASAKSLRRIQQEWLHRIIRTGVSWGWIPLAEAGVGVTRSGRIGVIGTRATIGLKSRAGVGQAQSGLRSTALRARSWCLVKEDMVGKPETNMILKYLRHLKDKKIDTLILGCTHYPFLQKDVERIMGKNCRVLNGPTIVSQKLSNYLHRHPEIEGRISKGGGVVFLTTDDPARFRVIGEKFLSQKIREVEKVALG
jgi:glutamate racemase